jgi:DNA-binding NtrC family response regulator
MRLGGETEIVVDVRVVAATNQDLRQLVEIGQFRRDLYYRLNVLHIHLPPLRGRRPDIPLLVDHFIRESAREHDRTRVHVSPEALDILSRYAWPGNVRELKNLVESMVVLSPGTIVRPEDIPAEIRDGSAGRNLLPVPLPRRGEGGQPAPELEFIFRTLLQLRMHIEDLRRDFDVYRTAHPELGSPVHVPQRYPLPPVGLMRDAEIQDVEPEDDEQLDKEHEVVVYLPGMTLKDRDQAAVTAALRAVAGNRRRAAELLGMGERTLSRKIKEYDLPL